MRPSPTGRPASLPKILVAEDHHDSRDALRMLLEAFDFDVVVAENGAQAIERALGDRPDLILMDIMMPEMDGLEAIRRLRREKSMTKVPIIAVTAMEGAHGPSLQAGASDFVRKPVDTNLLLKKIRESLEQEPEG
jgi:CheY-like chemotaxis protein